MKKKGITRERNREYTLRQFEREKKQVYDPKSEVESDKNKSGKKSSK